VNAPIARKVALKYRFGGASSELEKTFPPASNETVLAEGSIRVRTGVMFRRVGELRLTNQRLVIVSHSHSNLIVGLSFLEARSRRSIASDRGSRSSSQRLQARTK
jgi:hypothetical protein